MKLTRLLGSFFFSLAIAANASDTAAQTEPVPAQGGAAIVPAVISGDDQIGFSNMVSLILAAAHGLPVMAVAYGAGINEQRG